MRDTLSKPLTEPEEGPARINKRRLVRWIAVLTIGIVVVLAIWQDPALRVTGLVGADLVSIDLGHQRGLARRVQEALLDGGAGQPGHAPVVEAEQLLGDGVLLPRGWCRTSAGRPS